MRCLLDRCNDALVKWVGDLDTLVWDSTLECPLSLCPAAAAGAAHALALLNPQPHIPCTCLAQLRFSVKHSALTLEGMQLGVCW